jgi:Holliday junction resolvase RusA-like endonuclease
MAEAGAAILMTQKLEFVIAGEPVGKARPRFTRSGHTYTPAKTVNYENLVKLSFTDQIGYFVPNKEPVRMLLRAFYKIPKSTPKKYLADMGHGIIQPMKKPDADNIIKSVADALNGIAYHDDAQIVSVLCEKYYSDRPRVEVTLIIG